MVYGKTWRPWAPSSLDAHHSNVCRILQSTGMPLAKGWLKCAAVTQQEIVTSTSWLHKETWLSQVIYRSLFPISSWGPGGWGTESGAYSPARAHFLLRNGSQQTFLSESQVTCLNRKVLQISSLSLNHWMQKQNPTPLSFFKCLNLV